MRFFGQRAGVLDLLLARASPTWVFGGVIFVSSPGVHHAARTEARVELGEVLSRGPVNIFRLFFGVQVIEIAKEFIKAMIGGQEFVFVTKVVFAKLPGGIAQRLEQFGNGGIFAAQTDVRTGHPHFG